MFARIILPLAVDSFYTYLVTPRLEAKAGRGRRCVVQFGAKRYYTGVIYDLQAEAPAEVSGPIKEISDILDEQPILLPEQLTLWDWMTGYYMATYGEVMKAALPSGLKIESETLLQLADGFEELADHPLTPTERRLLASLSADKKHSLLTLEKELGVKSLMQPLRRLMQLGAVSVKEGLVHSYKPRFEAFVTIDPALMHEPTLHLRLDRLRRAPAQQQLLFRYLHLADAAHALRQGRHDLLRPVRRSELCEGNPSASAALAALRSKGLLLIEEKEQSRLLPTKEQLAREEADVRPPHPLSPAQQTAMIQIKDCFRERSVCLLHGVTSSGKTEVYIHLIEEAIGRGEQVLFLVPEIALTTQLTQRLRRVFGSRMGVYHSRFPDARRVEVWMKQCSPEPYDLLLGVRSSIFLPMPRLGLVIIDEEHETSYKQQDPAPRYHARDLAILMASRCGAKVLLGSATPSVESYHNAQCGKYGLVALSSRYAEQPLPRIVVEDLGELRRKKLLKSPFSPRLLDEVNLALSQGKQAILFQNRRGYSPVLTCHACGWTPQCTKCDVSLTYHRRLGRLVCHYCGTAYDLPRQCPSCGHTELRDIGYGTEKIEAEARQAFKGARTLRMDLDTTRSRSAYEDIIDDFQSLRSNLLIGTQMVTKGLDFSHVQVVGILNADMMINMPDFRAHERAFQMLSQVAGRAGRKEGQGLVVLQTRQPALPLIDQVVRADYRGMYEAQLQERRDFLYPPFCRLINIYLRHRRDDVVSHAAAHYAALLQPGFGPAAILGPDRPLVARVRLLYIRKLTLKVSLTAPTAAIRLTLRQALRSLHGFDVYKGVTVTFDVDPQ